MLQTTPPPGSLIGAPVPRAEGPDKLTGSSVYAADVALPGTLWAGILRSPHAHARILRVDEGAKRAVATGAKDLKDVLPCAYAFDASAARSRRTTPI